MFEYFMHELSRHLLDRQRWERYEYLQTIRELEYMEWNAKDGLTLLKGELAKRYPQNEIAAQDEIEEVPYFGGCPQCGRTDGLMNVGCDHWFTCSEHRTRWYIGSNLFGGWKDESEEDWEWNRQKLGNYTEVKPVHEWPGRRLAWEKPE